MVLVNAELVLVQLIFGFPDQTFKIEIRIQGNYSSIERRDGRGGNPGQGDPLVGRFGGLFSNPINKINARPSLIPHSFSFPVVNLSRQTASRYTLTPQAG